MAILMVSLPSTVSQQPALERPDLQGRSFFETRYSHWTIFKLLILRWCCYNKIPIDPFFSHSIINYQQSPHINLVVKALYIMIFPTRIPHWHLGRVVAMEVMQFGFAKTEESVATASESSARDANVFHRKTWNSCIVSRQNSGNLISYIYISLSIVYFQTGWAPSSSIQKPSWNSPRIFFLTGQLPKKWWILHF